MTPQSSGNQPMTRNVIDMAESLGQSGRAGNMPANGAARELFALAGNCGWRGARHEVRQSRP
jgi:hypothetical protein